MPDIGQVVRCAETGKAFVVMQTGMTFNYATDDAGNVYSDEGVDIRERRALLDRSRPFGGYLSSCGRHMTGWKGNILGTVVSSHPMRLARWSYVHGKTIQCVRVRDVHGNHGSAVATLEFALTFVR